MHRVFGIKENAAYIDREGAYVLPVKDGRLGIVKTPKGYFLLGGGIEKSETPAECIQRECMEETGCPVRVREKLCSAETWCIHSTAGYFHPIQSYYCGELYGKTTEPIEKDHTLLWVDFDEIRGKMFSEMQNWAVEQLLRRLSGK